MILETNIPNYTLRRGKVRDVYDLGGTMLIMVTTDRISAFDHVLPNGIPDKGRVLTQLSLFWAEVLDVYYCAISTKLNHMPEAFRLSELDGRTMLVEKANVIPFECVVRGYLCGSAWKEYQKSGTVCGISLPGGLKENQQFPEPIFTPSTKAETGHDENVTFQYMADKIGVEVASELESRSIAIYKEAARHAWEVGIIIADTKFEWGFLPNADNELILIDEVLTPDSSRFWPLDAYKLGGSMPSFDKQYLRDWLESSGWNKNDPPPEIPQDVILKTREKYLEAFERLTGRKLEDTEDEDEGGI